MKKRHFDVKQTVHIGNAKQANCNVAMIGELGGLSGAYIREMAS